VLHNICTTLVQNCTVKRARAKQSMILNALHNSMATKDKEKMSISFTAILLLNKGYLSVSL